MATHAQISADCHSLSQLLCKLGLVPGPMKAFRLRDDGQIDIWFVAASGAADVKRASARLVRGVAEVSPGSPRRVYLDVRVQSHAGKWRDLDADYAATGLEAPHVYDGACHIGLRLDVARGEGEYWDAGEDWVVNTTESLPYFRHLPGDRERALDEARARIAAFERE